MKRYSTLLKDYNKGFSTLFLVLIVLLFFFSLVILYFFRFRYVLTTNISPSKPKVVGHNVHGSLISVSDVATLPDYPLADWGVVVIPLSAMEHWTEELLPTEVDNLFLFEPSFEDSLSNVVFADASGEFSFEIPPQQEHVLCYLRPAANEGTYRVTDCVMFALYGTETLDASFRHPYSGPVCLNDQTCEEYHIAVTERQESSTN